MATTLPQLQPLAMPFANNGDKNTIPDSASDTPGKASLSEGFPPITQTPIEDGGIPPSRADFNGILNLATRLQYFLQQGGYFTFDTTVATLLGGYPENAVLYNLQSDGSIHLLKSAKTNNTDNFITTPSVIGTSWIDVTPGAGNVVYYSPDGDTGNSLLQNEDGTKIVVSGESLPDNIDISGHVFAQLARFNNQRIRQQAIDTFFEIMYEDANDKDTATLRAMRQTNGNSSFEMQVRGTNEAIAGSIALKYANGVFQSYLSKCSGGDTEIARCDWVKSSILASVESARLPNSGTSEGYFWVKFVNGFIIEGGFETDLTTSWKTITYPRAFTQNLGVVCTIDAVDSNAANNVIIGNRNATNFQIRASKEGPYGGTWLAYGF